MRAELFSAGFTMCILGMLAFGDSTTTSAPTDPLAGAGEMGVSRRPGTVITDWKEYFRDGAKVGERSFYKNGRVAEEKLFKDGVLDGICRRFYQSGKLFSESPYEGGKLNGMVRFYKENGDLLGESNIKKGNGVLRQFPNRDLGLFGDQEIPYKDGLIDGTLREWDRFRDFRDGGGIGCRVTQYVKGELEGWLISFDEKGVPIDSGYFHKNDLDGVVREYRPDGKLKDGYPKYYIFVGGETILESQPVKEAAYREAAKNAPILAKSLNDDGLEWARAACKAPRVGAQSATAASDQKEHK
jgi:antitoxin component YwqK of YwqJK toxin-antitoxin module